MSRSFDDIPVDALIAHTGFVRSLARSLVADAARADDVVQETFLAALERPPRHKSALVAWLGTTTRRIAAKLVRGEIRRRAREQAVAAPERIAPTDTLVSRLNVQQQVVQAVIALREPYRGTLLLRYYEDRSVAEIAEQLGLSRGAVRARIARGLSLLRESLDSKLGGRGPSWLQALAPLWAGKAAAAAATTQATASGGGLLVTGLLIMKTKLLIGAACLGIACLLVLTSDMLFEQDSEKAALKALGPSSAASTVAPSPGAEMTPAARREEITPPTEMAGLEPAEGVSTGMLCFRVIDAYRDELLNRVEARFMNETRFGQHGSSGEVRVCLTTGVYTCSVFAHGYDPARIEGVEVRENETTDLGTVSMTPGSGTIEGIVVAPHIGPDEPIAVELLGWGRRPCELCRARASSEGAPASEKAHEVCSCGYTKDKTTCAVRADRQFSFTSLAAGTYYLETSCAASHYPLLAEIVLDPRGCAWTTLTIVPEVELSLHLVRESGRPYFTRVQRELPEDYDGLEDVEELSWASLNFDFYRGEQPLAHGDAKVYIGDLVVTEEESEYFERRFLSCMVGKPLPIDRDRTNSDTLLPVFPRPGQPVVSLEVEGRDANSWTLSPLPALPVELQATFRGDSSGRIPLDLSRWIGGSLEVTLKSPEN